MGDLIEIDFGGDKKEPGVVRLQVNINPETADVLRHWAEEDGTNVTEQVRYMASLYDHLRKASQAGEEIQTSKRRRLGGYTITTINGIWSQD